MFGHVDQGTNRLLTIRSLFVPCRGSYYCPTTTTRVACPSRHFCRQGSAAPERCPPGAVCPAGTEIFDDNFTGFTVDTLLVLTLCLLWQLSIWYTAVMRRLASMDRLASIWGRKDATPGAGPPRERGSGRHATRARRLFAWAPWWKRAGGDENGGVDSGDGEAATRESALDSPLIPSSSAVPDVPGADAGMLDGGQAPEPLRTTSSSSSELTSHSSFSNVLTSDLLTEQEAHTSLPPLACPAQLEIEFVSLGLVLGSGAGRRALLRGVTGRLAAARLTAIMGPSGAGKTTLLAALAGRARRGRRSGRVLINGVPDRLERYRRVAGVVPQDDIVYPDLTVHEALTFAARFRLPAGTGAAGREAVVRRVLRVLGLREIADELIGDPETRGISGGQKKRVSIGMELVAEPRLLLLDEPTSGLDASASRALVAALRAVTGDAGVTAAAVVHQPSAQVLAMLDDVLLLGQGGRTVYYGPAEELEGYFRRLGFAVPPQTNPADAFLDILTGALGREADGAVVHSDALADAWRDCAGVVVAVDGVGERDSLDDARVVPTTYETSSPARAPRRSRLARWPALQHWRRRLADAAAYGFDQLHASLTELWLGAVRGVRRVDGSLEGSRRGGLVLAPGPSGLAVAGRSVDSLSLGMLYHFVYRW